MAFSLRSSIKSKLFSNSPSLLLKVKELVLSVGNPVSRGITALALKVNEKGVSPMDLQSVVRYVHRMCDNSSTHFPFASSNLFLSPLTLTLLIASACPFPCGYAGVEYLFIMPRSHQYLLKALLSNCKSLSEMRARGTLNLVTIFFQMNFIASISLIFANGSTSTHLVK